MLSHLLRISCVGVACAATANATPLDDYVGAADSAYQWEAVEHVSSDTTDVHLLRLHSQEWNGRRWSHYLTVAIPHKVTASTGLLMVLGDNKDGVPRATLDSVIVRIADATGAVVAKVGQTPNQPFVFDDEWHDKYKRAGRKEDSLIAYTWHQYLQTGDSGWPLQLPMTKAVSAAMDAVQEFCTEKKTALPVENFVLTGKSKRGWVSWTTAAVDNRVIAVVPMVIDCLNLRDSFVHHLRSYGEWSPAVQEYLEIDLPHWWLEPQFHELMTIVEPYHYRDRLTMPKYVINSTGDAFFPADSSRHYFDELQGTKHLRYIPNSDHTLGDTDYQESLAAYFDVIIHNKALPTLDWQLKDGTLTLSCDRTPATVTLWTAQNSKERDFRRYKVGNAWSPTPIAPDAEGHYQIAVEDPSHGYRAYLLEAKFDDGLTFTTDVFIVPDELPFVGIESQYGGPKARRKGEQVTPVAASTP